MHPELFSDPLRQPPAGGAMTQQAASDWTAALAALQAYQPPSDQDVRTGVESPLVQKVRRAKRHAAAFFLMAAILGSLGALCMHNGREMAMALLVLAATIPTVLGLRALLDLDPYPHLQEGWLCLPVRPDVARELVGDMLEDPAVQALVAKWSEQLGKLRLHELNQLKSASPAWAACHSTNPLRPNNFSQHDQPVPSNHSTNQEYT